MNSFDLMSRSLFVIFSQWVSCDSHCECSLSTVVVFVFVGPCPVLCALLLLFGLLSDETQIWLGDLRVVWCGACLVLFVFGSHVDCCCVHGHSVMYLVFLLIHFSFYQDRASCDIGQTGGKKILRYDGFCDDLHFFACLTGRLHLPPHQWGVVDSITIAAVSLRQKQDYSCSRWTLQNQQ